LKYEIDIAENISQNVSGQQEARDNNNSSLKKPLMIENKISPFEED
jgi:hypothetical protein